MANAQKIGRDDWIRTSDPLNPIHRTGHVVSDCWGWRSDAETRSSEADLWANQVPRWPLFVSVVLALAVFAAYVGPWMHGILEHVTRSLAWM